jgi:hypothetical protein
MAKATIHAGVCGFTTTVRTTAYDDDPRRVDLAIESECAAVRKLAEALPHVDPFQEIAFRRGMPQTHAAAHEYCTHAACPVPSGIIKAVEVAAGLALPADVTMRITHDED